MNRSWHTSLLFRTFVCSALAAGSFPAPSISQDLDSPLVTKARDQRCSIEVRGKDSVFTVHVTGLVPNETVKVTSNSEGESIQYEAQADEVGTYTYIEIPLVTGFHSGIVRITVVASRCRLKVSFPWRE